MHPIRLVHSSLPNVRSFHVQSSLVFAMNTIATAVPPCSARAAADGELAEQERVPFLGDFDVTDSGVGHLWDESGNCGDYAAEGTSDTHVDLSGGLADPGRSSACTAADYLVSGI